MMGVHQTQNDLFSYSVQLDKRVRPDHPLRQIAALIDFSFARAQTARFYGQNGNVSIDPAVILKLMFLLFYDNVASERELMGMVAERLDYLWFLGYGLDDEVPNHSVLSKARARWGKEVFETFFVRVVRQCVEKGLVDGKKIHIDSSLIDADASKDSVRKGPPELIAALKQAYQAQESKLSDTTTPEGYVAVNDRMVSETDPDAAIVRKGSDSARPRYHHHRVVDDGRGVVTAIKTTPGSIAEQSQLQTLVDQHQAHTERSADTVVADHKYGTVENFIACQQRGLRTHLGDVQAKQAQSQDRGIFAEEAFTYQPETNCYLCPAGQILKARKYHRESWEYATAKGVCLACPLRPQCTRSRTGRTLKRYREQALLDRAREQSHSPAGRRDRQRRQQIMEQSFADAANNHGFKRSRWRRLWRQEIQDWMIAAIQNIRIMIKNSSRKPLAVVTMAKAAGLGLVQGLETVLNRWLAEYLQLTPHLQKCSQPPLGYQLNSALGNTPLRCDSGFLSGRVDRF
jgi:transposase